MADMPTALRIRAISDAAVSAFVGQKVHWNMVPASSALPYVRLQVVSDPRPTHLKGRTAGRWTRVQADCFSMSHPEAFALAEALIVAVESPATVAGVRFGFTQSEGPHDLGEDVEGVGFVHRASVDLLVRHRLI